MGFQPTDNAVGVDFMFSGCLKDCLILFTPLLMGRLVGENAHPTAFLLFFRLPEKGYIYNCGRLKSRPYILNT
ncbi:MAG: hypothetical protein J5680_01625 [Neisseriaceae bacterium]|nr:hypothetical protein [Neisseriaceae bacterium]MBR5676411.1 hypothetical protein [Neisseriaceae bacterium]